MNAESAKKILEDFSTWSQGRPPIQCELQDIRDYIRARKPEIPEEAWDVLYASNIGKRLMFEVVEDERYESMDGWVLARETGLTPNGNPLGGRWVLRNPEHDFVDFDQYRNDLACGHGLEFIHIKG